MDSTKKISDLKALLSKRPGSPEFVELAKLLSTSNETRSEARDICFRGLTESPQNTQGRLMLARLFYLDGMTEFCIRELVELQNRVSTPSLTRLLDSFGGVSEQFVRPARSIDRKSENSKRTSGLSIERTSATPSIGASYSGDEDEEDEGGEDVVGDLDLDDEFLEVLVDLEDDDEE